MLLSFAPMEGVTSTSFRRLHRRFFGGADRYYAPFLSPDSQGAVKRTLLEALRPESGEELITVPQLLCSEARIFLTAAEKLTELGYREINLNLGCPSGTVTAKHKGAGVLCDRDQLRHLLDGIFAAPPCAVSVKTRMGWASTGEFPALLAIYADYPIAELIVHARDRAGMYRSNPDLAGFTAAVSRLPFPVCYNGDIFSPEALEKLQSLSPGLDRVMLGRGAVADPALFRLLRGGAPLSAGELSAFCEALLNDALDAGLPPVYALARMKELWYYLRTKFPGGEKALKSVFKSRRIEDYRAAVNALFDGGSFDPLAFFAGTADLS